MFQVGKWARFEGEVPRRNSVTVGYRFPPGPALVGCKQGLSEMRCKGQLETENERPSKNIKMEIGVKPLESQTRLVGDEM